MTRGELQRLVLQALDEAKPTSEAALRIVFAKRGIRGEDVQQAVNTLHARNDVRWVAFQGWCKGGRPE